MNSENMQGQRSQMHSPHIVSFKCPEQANLLGHKASSWFPETGGSVKRVVTAYKDELTTVGRWKYSGIRQQWWWLPKFVNTFKTSEMYILRG